MRNLRYLNKKQSLLAEIGAQLRAAILAFLIFIPLAIINPIQIMSALLIPFSPRLFRRLNRFLANYYWGLLVLALEKINHVKLDIIGDEIPMEENAIVDCNHQNIADIPLMMVLAWRRNRLGDMKFFVKDIVRYIPGPGWGMHFLDCIYVKRNWLSDRGTIEKTFQRLKDNRVPFWIVSFLEGTRITDAKLRKSQEFMAKRGHSVTQNIMAPRTKGFVASVTALKDHIDAVYTMTIYYPDGIPSLWQLFKGDCPGAILHVKRTAIQDLPKEDKAIESWVQNIYQEKDQLLEEFIQGDRQLPENLKKSPLQTSPA